MAQQNNMFRILILSLFSFSSVISVLNVTNIVFCPSPTYKTVYQPLKAIEGDVTDWVSQAALTQGDNGPCDANLIANSFPLTDVPWRPCPYRGDCPHTPIDPNATQYTRHDMDIISLWGFNDNNYLNFALQVYFFNDTNFCPPGGTIYPDKNVCYIAGINELSQIVPVYYRACVNSTGTGPTYNNTNGVCPAGFPTDFQLWFGPVSTPSGTRLRLFFILCNDPTDNSPEFKSWKEQVCDVPMDFSTIQTIILGGTDSLAFPQWSYEFPGTDFGVLSFGGGLYGSYLEARIPLSLIGASNPTWLNRQIFFNWQTGAVGPGFIQKHCPEPGTLWYIPLLCDLNPTGVNVTTGVPITFFPSIDCNSTFFFPPIITIDNKFHDPWPGEPPAPPSVRTYCNPTPKNLMNCSYLGNNTLIFGTQACCNPLNPGCVPNDTKCLPPTKDIQGVWMTTDGTYLYMRIDAPVGFNFSLVNGNYLSVCFDVPGFASGVSVPGDCGTGSLREVDFVLYYTQGRTVANPVLCGGPLFCQLPGLSLKNCSVTCGPTEDSCCVADWGKSHYGPYVTNVQWCTTCFPAQIIEFGIPLATLGFNGSVGAVFNYSVRFSNQGLAPNVQYPQAGGGQVILPCRVPVPQTTGTTGIPLVQIGTYVWFDTNYNGIRDEVGTGIPNVTVSLAYCNGSVFATTATNAQGQYLFTGIPSGASYEVFFNPATLPAGDFFTKSNVGSDKNDSDVINALTGAVACFFIPFGQNHLDADAGVYRSHCIGQYVWYDSNINGIQDAGEPGVGGIAVSLIVNSNNTVVATTTTNSTGYYLFCGLLPDNYTVTFQINPLNYTFTPVYHAPGFPNSDSDVNAALVVNGLGFVNVSLPPSTDSLHNDAGIISFGCLGDRVFLDANVNGQRDAGENGVGSVTVYLLNGTTVIATTLTNSTGYYLFCGLYPTLTGYRVTFVLPSPTFNFTTCQKAGVPTDVNSDACTFSGLNGTTGLIPVPPGQTILHNDAGIFGTGCIGQFVWFDANLNGLQDSGEPGVAGIPVTLRNSTGQVVGTQNTNGTGYYLFCGLKPDNYTVSFQINPATQAFTPVFQAPGNPNIDSDINPFAVVGGLGTTPVIPLPSGTNSLHNDAGIITFGCIGDRVFFDANVNGQQDAGEAGIGGVTVYLLNGTRVIATTTTNTTGYYLFCGLFPTLTGYQVTFVTPNNYVFTTCEKAGVAPSADSDACIISGKNGTTPLIPLPPGTINLDNDAGMFNLSCIGDFVWLDTNTNGIQNGGEPGISQITVTLSFCNGTVVGSTFTTANGGYSFCGLYPNNYFLTFGFNQTFYTCSPPTQGPDRCIDSDITNCNARNTTCFTVDTGVNDTCHDTGLYPFARIGDFVWSDTNANGIQNVGEPGLGGLRVDLLNGTTFAQINQTTTNANGNYIFQFLNPGQYRVRFYCPAGYVFTSYHTGANAAIDSDANFILPNDSSAISGLITLPTGAADLTWDAGCYQLSSIGDFVWIDLNGNGLQDAGEPGQAINVTLNFVNATNSYVVASTISGSNGFYLFSGLYPTNFLGGKYRVDFLINPVLFRFTNPLQGGNIAIDSDAVQQTVSLGQSGLIDLPPATNNLTIDAGLIRLAQTTGTTGTTGINIYCFACPFGNSISSFNLVTLDNLTMLNSDIEGRVAVGGSAWLDNTGIGASVSSSFSCLPVKNPALAALVVRRKLQKNGGITQGGNIYYGLSSSVISGQSLDPGCASFLNATAFNFINIQTYLQDLSDRLATGADFLPTGTVSYFTSSKTVSLTGQSGSNREVFWVDSAKVPTGGAVTWDINLPLGVDTVVINVNGTNINWNSAVTSTLQSIQSKIIWNFFEAQNLTIHGAFSGALLAPYANVNAPDGLLQGQVFVKSWNGPMEVHYVKFVGCIPFISLAVGADPQCTF